MPKTVIIGGGAPGLFAAVNAGKSGETDITDIEKKERPARKLMITGKGRCNLTNLSPLDLLIKNTVRNGRFLYSAFSSFSSEDTCSFFENCGVALKTERGNRVFPVSDKAVTVVDALVKEAKKYAKIITGRAVSLKTENGRITGVVLEDKTEIKAEKVIIATGGVSYPLTGSTGDGFALAKGVGHSVTELNPALVRLICHEGFCSFLAGLSLKNVTLSLFEGEKKKPVYKEMGEMLFTHSGISGPLSLTASSYIKDIKNNYTVSIDLKPALSEEQLDKRILRDFEERKNKDFKNSLDALLPKSIIPVIIKLSGIPQEIKINQITAPMRKNLIKIIKDFRLTVIERGPFEEAIITSGGVSVKEINPATMESKIVKGLYFAGEVIDVNALTGGFNLQIAFSTGYLAGKSLTE